MKLSKERYPVLELKEMRGEIDVRPDYQRPLVWTRKQKRLLIDSILRGYDVPKMYWHRQVADGKFDFHVIDGQQRLTTIWEFFDEGFALGRDSDPVENISIANLKYSDFDSKLKKRLHRYSFDIVIVEEAVQNEEEDEVREMFLRLQNGTTLKAQEKRNAMTGKMRDFVKDLSEHPFFESCKFKNSRFTYDLVAAQMTCLEIAGKSVSIRDGDLNKMYKEQSDFDKNGKVAKKIKDVLEYLHRAFPEKTPELEHHSVITLFSLVSEMIEKFDCNGTEQKLNEWFIDFERERETDKEKDEESRDIQLIEYQRLTGHSTDAEESLSSRLEQMQRRFFLEVPDLEQIDKTRNFSNSQRLSIYRRDNAQCQLKLTCEGNERLRWDNWHADHIVPHVRGGKTTVSNGQVACPQCNLSKGASNPTPD